MAKKRLVEEFKEFISQGNVLDMAIGVIIGGAFGKITSSLVNDVIMPVISILTGGIEFNSWKIVLKEAVVGADGVIDPATEVAMNFGALVATVMDFLIIAFVIFTVIKLINKFKRKAAKEAEEEAAEAEPSEEVKLLTEIRDALKK
ncbi:MAG TPA: large-conductance mechanosensitive channel protein MscL [Erysipelotrichaceae bacterium]|nr:large-conductance mechanosensitive channel protein MscL [Erysipelotrichaceae bacterium]HQB31960.1 large-conductance mechanosensitive channel protein MscL [Erysipelotrichaceae bacterium]